MPGFQKCTGRQWTSWSLIQCQAPRCFGLLVTCRCFSIEALSVTATSNFTITGMPTPTVSFGSGAILG